MMTTTMRGRRDLGGAVADRELRVQPARERRRERGVADDAVQDADRGDADLHHREQLGRVVVQRHARGCAPESPASTITCSRALRLAVSAISDMANRALRKIRKSRRATSMRGRGGRGRPA